MILIALGANLPSAAGPPAVTLRKALLRLEERGVKIHSLSSFYETSAWPDASEPAFVNAVAAVETALPPVDLLTLLHSVETDFGRLRSSPNASRTLDLDLLDYEGRVTADGVTLPHPRLAQRAFVLVPLAEIAPLWRHPVSGQTAGGLLAALPDQGRDQGVCKKLA
ncbi:MAG TPA: 2-amino-4-hydroxy-6-hydroxymethyldihydropteridine diphosphokinase [Rhizomicrobium sp.]|nr:2-amino-4-hydroxy-6-hydroxymethyldihydropteridine diphosphokinase [Rhizomicrobium sp.]